jgi:hypothetical protein
MASAVAGAVQNPPNLTDITSFGYISAEGALMFERPPRLWSFGEKCTVSAALLKTSSAGLQLPGLAAARLTPPKHPSLAVERRLWQDGRAAGRIPAEVGGESVTSMSSATTARMPTRMLKGS